MIIRKLIVSPLYFLTAQKNQLNFIEENGVGSKVLTNIQGQY